MTTFSGWRLGPYEVLEQIGRGGMASVYKAYDRIEDRFVALKILSPAMAQHKQFSERFRREARVVMHLDHPNIVPVEGFGDQDGYAYLVMPYLDVGSLADRLKLGELTPLGGARMIERISDALDYAHRQGVVHRDIKPSNILIDREGNALLSDFGLARIHDASLSLTGSALIGTPAYMSPEQARGEPVDGRSDQYSLGVILFQLATGRLPFEADTPMGVVVKHMHDPIPAPRTVSPELSDSMERVILKATAKDPGDRFDSMGALNEAFQAALAHSLDPEVHPAPEIPLAPSALATEVQPRPAFAPLRRLSPRTRAAAMAALLLLFALVYPAASSGLLGFLGNDTSVLLSSSLIAAERSSVQLTAMGATIEALSTELAETKGDSLSAEGIQTAVMETLQAMPTETGASGQALATPTPTGGPPAGSASEPTTAPTASRTPRPSPTPRRTATQTEPTAIPSLAITASPAFSPSPGHTPPFSPSATPSPTVDVCAAAALGSFSGDESKVRWSLSNGGPAAFQITGLYLDWPGSNDELKKVRFDGKVIWDAKDGAPPTSISSNWKGSSQLRRLASGETAALTFEFTEEAEDPGYALEVTLNSGCILAAGD